MVKLILSIIILLSCILAGQLKARHFENRVGHIQDYITAIRILESEMTYRLDPLPEIFLRIGSSNDNLAGKLFATASRMLKETQHHDFAQFWKEATFQVYEASSLTEADKEVIAAFGVELGQTDMENQRGLFARSTSLMEVQLAEAMEEKRTKGKMYKSLGAAIGAFIVILLI